MQAIGETAPLAPGSGETMTVSGLSPNTMYYFAVKTSDEVPNESSLSNVPNLATLPVVELQADSLAVDITNVAIDGGDNKRVVGITIEDSGASDITIDRMAVSWTDAPGGTKINEIIIDSGSVWSGKSNSGTELDIADFTLISGAGSYAIDSLDFSKNMTGATLSIIFTMGDGSVKTISNIQP